MRNVKSGLLAAVLVASVIAPPVSSAAASPGGAATVCLVPRGAPTVEHTVRVPAAAVPRLLRTTLSYTGPCATYGERAPLGRGELVAYGQAVDGVPVAIGLAFPATTLDGLPVHPATGGLWCFDRNGDGTVDHFAECSGGYEHALHFSRALHLPTDFRSTVDTPFTYLLVNWNPAGHIPIGVYNVPHFDLHFYLNSNAERLAIRPGPCPVLVHCDDYPLGKLLPAARYRTADHADVDAVEPAMGNHLIDVTGPEFGGQPFTHSFIYGVWNSHITFYEPMVTHAWFTGLRLGTRTDQCFALKLPQAWERSGWYPTSYCLRYRANRKELIASLENFVFRTAG